MNKVMPAVGYGLWKVPAAECNEVVYQAIKTGYRLFDAACDYGNEAECGEGLARAIKEGLVKREDVFITSKLWNTFHAKENILEVTKKQLADWQVDYFDLFLIHFPVALAHVPIEERYPPEWWNGTVGGKVTVENIPMSETWQGLVELKQAGLAKEIGVSNCNGSILIDLIRAAKRAHGPNAETPKVLQIEHHPYLTQEPLLALCKTLGIAVTGYSSFGPQSFLELSHAGAMDTPSLLKHSTIAQIAESHKKTPAQVLLRWATQRGIYIIPKSSNVQRAKENLDSVNFNLTNADLKTISALNQNLRFNDPAGISPELAIFA